MRRPNKPHVDGYEDEEDCEGYFNQWEADRRGCFNTLSRNPNDPCRICIEKGRAEEAAKCEADRDAMTQEERDYLTRLSEELKKLY